MMQKQLPVQESINGKGQINHQLKKTAALAELLACKCMEQWDGKQNHTSAGRNHRFRLVVLQTGAFFRVLKVRKKKTKPNTHRTTQPQNSVWENKGEKRFFLFYSFLYQDFFFVLSPQVFLHEHSPLFQEASLLTAWVSWMFCDAESCDPFSLCMLKTAVCI